MTQPTILMDRTYSGESIIDASQDIDDMWETPVTRAIPDTDGIPSGTFRITITWVPDED